jgi:hypothetical protein
MQPGYKAARALDQLTSFLGRIDVCQWRRSRSADQVGRCGTLPSTEMTLGMLCRWNDT